MPWGHNKRLRPQDVKRAVLEHLQRLGSRTDKQVPDDIVEFLDKADLIFLDDNNQPVHFARLVVAWED